MTDGSGSQESGGTAPPRLPPAYSLVALDSVDSTNAEALRQARTGAPDGTLVWALEQTAGRGRRGRAWASPRGNLYLSLVLRPEAELATASQLGFAAALALVEALGSLAPPLLEVTVKWPNDVLVNGRKAAGILLESQTAPDGGLEALILGVGVNIEHYPEDTPFPATSLRAEGAGGDITPAMLLEAFARHFQSWVNRWLDDGFGPVRRTWLAWASGLGEAIEVRLPNATRRGRFRDLDAQGQLVLETADGRTERISVGDVFFGR